MKLPDPVSLALSTLTRHWRLIALALLLAALGAQTLRLSASRAAHDREIAGRALDRAAYEHAQAVATAKALSAKLEKEAEHARIKEEADAAAADWAARYRAAVLRHAAAQRAAGGPDMPRPTESAESVAGSGASPVIHAGLMISEADAFICADNTGRLQAARTWALSLDGE